MAMTGGIWVNFGPLLYHWASVSPGSFLEEGDSCSDPRYRQSVELSWEELRHVICNTSYDFRLEREEMREGVTYAANTRSMMQTTYNCVFFTAVKGSSLPKQEGKEG